MKKRLTIAVCDIDELEKSEQKTGNVTQINARHKISKCMYIVHICRQREFLKCQRTSLFFFFIKNEMEGIEISKGNEKEASPELNPQNRNLI